MLNTTAFAYFCEWPFFIPLGAFRENKNEAETGLGFATPPTYKHGLERTWLLVARASGLDCHELCR